jgi:phosphorylcholine metabolism protein LicD
MMQEDGKVADDRISISISRKAYEALVEYTKQLNQENQEADKSFTVEEVLDEEIIFLFSDEWKKEQ